MEAQNSIESNVVSMVCDVVSTYFVQFVLTPNLGTIVYHL